MRTISHITQSRLSVFVFDKDNHNPIARMPLYAEVAVMGRKAPSKVDPNSLTLDHDLLRDPRLLAALIGAIEQYLGADYFNGLDPSERQVLKAKFIERLPTSFMGMPAEKQAKAIEKAVKSLAEEMGIVPDPAAALELLGTYPLGLLATDHVGYLSYNIARIPGTPFPSQSDFQYAIYLYPMGNEGARIDALAQGRISPDLIVAKLEIARPVFEPDLRTLKLPAMQYPDLADWYMSPGSFATLPAGLIGADGCENLMPANFATQEFRFRQVVRVRAVDAPQGFPPEYRYGFVDEYKVSFVPIGHSLGEIKYSLPLAPGESVKLAVVDWSRTDSTVRTEDTQFAEKLMHDTHRDRSISETVQSAMNEWQRGGNVQGGANVSLFGIISLGGGGGYSTSSGSRELAASNVQNLADSFSQSSSALREFHSTVVVQSKQEEKESIQTRTFTNYNHSHTLTILYYEILRHFRVVTEWVNRKPVALIPLDRFPFSDEVLIKYRHLLEPNLLDQNLRVGFDAIEKLSRFKLDYQLKGLDPQRDSFGPNPGEIQFNVFEIGLKSGAGINQNILQTEEEQIRKSILTPGGILGEIRGYLLKKDGKRIPFFRDTATGDERFNLNHDGRLYNHFFHIWQVIRTPELVRWGDIAGIILHNASSGDAWVWESVRLLGFANPEGKIELMKDTPLNHMLVGKLMDGDDLVAEGSFDSYTGIVAPPPPALLAPSLEKNLTVEEHYSALKLRHHFSEFSDHYYRLILLNRESNTWASAFDPLTWPGTNEEILDHIVPIALERFGNHVAFPLVETGNELAQKLKTIQDAIKSDDPVRHSQAIELLRGLDDQDFEAQLVAVAQTQAKVEKLISIPTRGVFAEGKLGHCNISEEIDDTRFWKWEEHPIPFEAPGINPVNPITPTSIQQNVQPSPFPNSSINIVSPTAAPDPNGLAEALKVLATPSIFRDMSGRQEVADLLKSLSSETISMAEAKKKAADIQSKYGGDLTAAPVASKIGESSNSKTGSVGTEDLAQRASLVKGLVGIASAKTAREAADLVLKKSSIFDSGAVAANEGGPIAGENEWENFYTDYLNVHYPNLNPLEDSPYTRNRDYYTLRAYNKSGISKHAWNPTTGFKANETNIRKVYDYYQVTFSANPEKFLWAGLGRLAGGAVLGGLLTPGMDDQSFLKCAMVLIGKAIFLDLAWMHELYLEDPIKAIAMAGEHDNHFPAVLSYESAWKKIHSGNPPEVLEGNRMLLQNEQFTIIQPLYDRIKLSSDAYYFSKTNPFTRNVHPYHQNFLDSFPSTRVMDVTIAKDRWEWINLAGGMWEKWGSMPRSEKERLATLSMDELIRQQWGTVIPSLFPPGV